MPGAPLKGPSRWPCGRPAPPTGPGIRSLPRWAESRTGRRCGATSVPESSGRQAMNPRALRVLYAVLAAAGLNPALRAADVPDTRLVELVEGANSLRPGRAL